VFAFELALWEGTFEEPPFFVTQLSKFIISPDKKGSVIECRHTVTTTASQVVDAQGFVLVEVYKT
jgi:hypothetical protein